MRPRSRWSGALGNVDTHAAGAALLRLGYALPRSFDTQSGDRRLLLPGAAAGPAEPSSVYVFAGLEGRLVLQNIFLDGNTFRSSHSVSKEELVGVPSLGVAWGTAASASPTRACSSPTSSRVSPTARPTARSPWDGAGASESRAGRACATASPGNRGLPAGKAGNGPGLLAAPGLLWRMSGSEASAQPPTRDCERHAGPSHPS